MRKLGFFLGTGLALGIALSAMPARADIPPPGLCQANMLGQPCEFAVDKDGKEVGPGVCVAEMCSRATPDGPMQYDCVMCRPPKDDPNGAAGAGAGGEGGADPVGPMGGSGGGDPVKPPVAGSATGGNGTAGSNNGKAGAPSNNNADSNTDGGCSVAHGARGTAVTLAGLGLALGLVLRRRSSNLVKR